MANKLKIFEIGDDTDKDWVIAYTNIQALSILTSETGMSLGDLELSSVKKLPKKLWSEYFVFDEFGNKEISFGLFMLTVDEPTYLASTNQ